MSSLFRILALVTLCGLVGCTSNTVTPNPPGDADESVLTTSAIRDSVESPSVATAEVAFQVVGAAELQEKLNRWKGKVVLVDMWSTW